MRILIATTGVLPPTPTSRMVDRLLAGGGDVTVMTVVQVPRTFLDSMDDAERRSFLDDDQAMSDERKAAAYLEERGQRAVDPILAGLRAAGIEPAVRFVEGDDPAEAIIDTARDTAADLVMMGATRRLFTEQAWTSVSSRVMEKTQVPLLLIPGTRSEDTGELPRVEL